MGFPFIFWGGGDGSSDVARGGTASEAGTAGVAGAAGAAGAMGGQRPLSEDEQIYGPQPGQTPSQPGQSGEAGQFPPGPGVEGQGWEQEGWAPDGEEVMEDPWGEEQDDGGMFGGMFGGGDAGGGGGDGGSWGDWS